ncbi:ferric reductase like transmembrane component-domain-containing protein [Mycena crocata]|nr:ferric reductase like transmembrane component-domain-containing protein [Mycena crocata]
MDFHIDARVVTPDRAPSHYRAYEYPRRVWYLLGSFIALVSLCHFAIVLASRLRSPAKPSTRGLTSIRRLPIAILNLVRNAAFRITISFGGAYKLNVAEFFLGSAYIATMFTWALINTTNLAGVRLSPQYYANRTGLIAATQFPLLVALGMKNNILTFLTGVSFDKLNILHRIGARTLCVMLWIHGSGHIIENGRAGNIEDLQETWFRCGIMAISSLTLMCLLSVQPLRSRMYELFLVAHFFVALIFLCGAYYHAENNGLGYYLWPSLLLWGLDRFLRFVRIFFVNGGYETLFNTKTSHALRAKIEVISPQFLRVTVRRPDHFTWTPGQLAYLSIPSISATPWEAHPFTIASIDGDISQATDSRRPSRNDSFEKPEAHSIESVLAAVEELSPLGYSKRLVFLLRVHDGFTKRLLHSASSNSSFSAYIDGPYCSPPSVRGFGTVLLFCGGSGISFILPLFLDIVRGANSGTNPTCQKVMFVWAVRHPEQIEAISDDLLWALGSVSESLCVDIRIHVTTPMEGSEKRVNLLLLDVPAVRILSGRPEVREIVTSEVAATSGSMSINVCGTTGLAEHVRSALRSASSVSDILKGGPSVSLHVEAFGM